MRIIALFLTCIFFKCQLSGQNEIDIISINYYSIGESTYNFATIPILNDVKSSVSEFNLSLNYGHRLGKAGLLSLFYGLDYGFKKNRVNLSRVKKDSSFLAIPKQYYIQPNYSKISASIGLEKKMKHNWKFISGLTINSTIDFAGSKLKHKLLFSNVTYVEKKINRKLDIGFGQFINQLQGRFFIYPLLKLSYKNDKRGVEFLLPSSIRFYHKIKKPSYIELTTVFDSYSIVYQNINPVVFSDVFSLTTTFSYNYLWQDFLKLSFAVNFPLREFTITSSNYIFKYSQYEGLGLRIGISVVVDDD